MLPKLSPIGKTSVELRRAINRIEQYIELNPEAVDAKVAEKLLGELKEARSHIPKDMRDPDLKEG